MKLSVLITDHNDHEECNLTVQSIRETAGDKPEVIVIDDGSPSILRLKDKDARFYRLQHRIGVGPARHYAACKATGEWILIVDSHMRFVPGWYEAALDVLQSRSQQTLWCCQCVNLMPGDMDISKSHGRYHGATILFSGPDTGAPGKHQVLEGKWSKARPDDGYETESIMGASYLMNRDWFFQLGGLRLLRAWGSDEPYLSLRTWLSGGECRFTKRVQIGHQFREKAFHSTPTGNHIYNKMMVAMTCLPDYAWAAVVRDLPKQYLLAGDVAVAKRLIEEHRPEIEVERAYLESMQKMSFEEYCEKFKVQKFW